MAARKVGPHALRDGRWCGGLLRGTSARLMLDAPVVRPDCGLRSRTSRASPAMGGKEQTVARPQGAPERDVESVATCGREHGQRRRFRGVLEGTRDEMPKAKRTSSPVAARRSPGLRHFHRLPSRSDLSTAVVGGRQGHGRGTPSGRRTAGLPLTQEPSADWPALGSGRTMETQALASWVWRESASPARGGRP